MSNLAGREGSIVSSPAAGKPEFVMTTAPHSSIRRALLVAAAAILLPPPVLAQSAAADITPQEARTRAAAGKLRLIDIRTPEEWRETGVAPGAARINLYHPDGAEGFTRELLKLVDGDRNAPIALICRSGNRSTQAQRYLAEQGFTRVYNVREGMLGGSAGPGWVSRGLPVESCKNC